MLFRNRKKVAKFGGSSLADAEQFRKVKEIIESGANIEFYRELEATEKDLKEDTCKLACYKANIAWKSKNVLEESLKEQGMDKLFYEFF